MIEDFVGIYDNFFTEEECEAAIGHFLDMERSGFVWNRQFSGNCKKHELNDVNFSMIDVQQEDVSIPMKFFQEFNNRLLQRFWNNVYPDYTSKYSVLHESDNHQIYNTKFQRTGIGGGYHKWHFESSERLSATRVMAYILYLNDVEEGGETEFLYYPKRIKPKAGTFTLFPAAYTHTHRGNPPISNEKYIVTGWVEF